MHAITRFVVLCRAAVVLAAAVAATALADDAPPADARITGGPDGGVLDIGQSITWTITRPADRPAVALHYRVRQNNAKVLSGGDLPADQATVDVPASLGEPGWLYLEVTAADGKGGTKLVTSAGAVVAPDRIAAASPVPADFESFWNEQIKTLADVPPNAVETKLDSGKAGVEQFDVTLDAGAAGHTHALLARPEKGEKFPAIIQYTAAGVKPLPKTLSINYAADGWLALDVLAHDLPVLEPKEFYDKQAEGPLAKYTAIGNGSRETSYFRSMLVRDYQAIEYLTKRPDWDGRVLVVRGESQGGLQSIAMAGLHPNVTATIVTVPAGADTTGSTAGRDPGWPYWARMGQPEARAAVLETSRYFDPANFAPRVHCPVLATAGLCDTTAAPTSIISMFNRLGGKKELVLMPEATHLKQHEKSNASIARWMESLNKNDAAP